MDFRDTPEEAAFRKEVREWLEANLDPADSSVSIGVVEDRVTALRAWQAKLQQGGWVAVS